MWLVLGFLLAPDQAMSEERACSNTDCYQVVPYQPKSILPMFEQKSRSFEFAGKTWVVIQEWEEIGVASVVWEPVSNCNCCTNAGNNSHVAYIPGYLTGQLPHRTGHLSPL